MCVVSSRSRRARFVVHSFRAMLLVVAVACVARASNFTCPGRWLLRLLLLLAVAAAAVAAASCAFTQSTGNEHETTFTFVRSILSKPHAQPLVFKPKPKLKL